MLSQNQEPPPGLTEKNITDCLVPAPVLTLHSVTGKAGKFYEDGTDALKMRKRLGPVTGEPAGQPLRRRLARAAPGATAA